MAATTDRGWPQQWHRAHWCLLELRAVGIHHRPGDGPLYKHKANPHLQELTAQACTAKPQHSLRDHRDNIEHQSALLNVCFSGAMVKHHEYSFL